MKKICLLGASGSIGQQTVEIIVEKQSMLSLTAVSVGYNTDYLEYLLQNFNSIKDVFTLDKSVIKRLAELFPTVQFHTSINSLLINAEYDVMVNAIVGFAGVEATITAIERQKDICLANKESLVVAGHLVMPLIEKYNVQLIPIDSEHSAIFQCLKGSLNKDIHKLILTASGGSFRDKSKAELKNITVEQALNHPNWKMGSMITIDSATMFNKGLEVIEAMWLFDLDLSKIEVVIHYQSIIHSMVQFNDYSIISQMGQPDMRQPIQYALLYPNKYNFSQAKEINFNEVLSLDFKPVDFKRFSALKLAYEAGRIGHSMPCVLNAAKEVATSLFLDGHIKFLEIEELVERAMSRHKLVSNPSFIQLEQIDQDTRKFINSEVIK